VTGDNVSRAKTITANHENSTRFCSDTLADDQRRSGARSRTEPIPNTSAHRHTHHHTVNHGVAHQHTRVQHPECHCADTAQSGFDPAVRSARCIPVRGGVPVVVTDHPGRIIVPQCAGNVGTGRSAIRGLIPRPALEYRVVERHGIAVRLCGGIFAHGSIPHRVRADALSTGCGTARRFDGYIGRHVYCRRHPEGIDSRVGAVRTRHVRVLYIQ
jgi:hypothetical protein